MPSSDSQTPPPCPNCGDLPPPDGQEGSAPPEDDSQDAAPEAAIVQRGDGDTQKHSFPQTLSSASNDADEIGSGSAPSESPPSEDSQPLDKAEREADATSTLSEDSQSFAEAKREADAEVEPDVHERDTHVSQKPLLDIIEESDLDRREGETRGEFIDRLQASKAQNGENDDQEDTEGLDLPTPDTFQASSDLDSNRSGLSPDAPTPKTNRATSEPEFDDNSELPSTDDVEPEQPPDYESTSSSEEASPTKSSSREETISTEGVPESLLDRAAPSERSSTSDDAPSEQADDESSSEKIERVDDQTDETSDDGESAPDALDSTQEYLHPEEVFEEDGDTEDHDEDGTSGSSDPLVPPPDALDDASPTASDEDTDSPRETDDPAASRDGPPSKTTSDEADAPPPTPPKTDAASPSKEGSPSNGASPDESQDNEISWPDASELTADALETGSTEHDPSPESSDDRATASGSPSPSPPPSSVDDPDDSNNDGGFSLDLPPPDESNSDSNDGESAPPSSREILEFGDEELGAKLQRDDADGQGPEDGGSPSSPPSLFDDEADEKAEPSDDEADEEATPTDGEANEETLQPESPGAEPPSSPPDGPSDIQELSETSTPDSTSSPTRTSEQLAPVSDSSSEGALSSSGLSDAHGSDETPAERMESPSGLSPREESSRRESTDTSPPPSPFSDSSSPSDESTGASPSDDDRNGPSPVDDTRAQASSDDRSNGAGWLVWTALGGLSLLGFAGGAVWWNSNASRSDSEPRATRTTSADASSMGRDREAERNDRALALDQALATVDEATRVDIDDPERQLEVAERLLERGDARSASRIYDVLWRQNSRDDLSFLRTYLDILQRAGRPQRRRAMAIEAIQRADEPRAQIETFRASLERDDVLQSYDPVELDRRDELATIRSANEIDFEGLVVTDGEDRRQFLFTPATEWRRHWRDDVAAWRFCRIIVCSFDIPRTQPARISRTAFRERFAGDLDEATIESRWRWVEREGPDGEMRRYLYGSLRDWPGDVVRWPIETFEVWRPWLEADGDPSRLEQPIREAVAGFQSRQDGRLHRALLDELDSGSVRPHAAQLSDIVVFDYLTNHWGRFQDDKTRYGTANHFRDGTFVTMRTETVFQPRKSRRVRGRFQWISRFRRDTVTALRHLDRDQVSSLLYPEPSTLEREKLEIVWEQHRDLLDRVDRLIERHSESAVLAFE